MALPSGFGIMELFPGILSNPPAFSFFQSGAGGLINQFITEATGSPRLVYSLVSGSGTTLNYISGNNNDFYFDKGRMLFGDSIPPPSSRTQSGELGIFWNGANGQPAYNGILCSQTNGVANSGSPAINLREAANVDYPTEFTTHIGTKVRSKSNLGNFTSTSLPGPMVYFATNCYTGADFRIPVVGGTNEQDNFYGFSWGNFDGAQNLYSNFSIYNDYVEIGKHKANDLKYSLEGDSALVLRNYTIPPVGYHPSGTSFYSSSDSILRVISSSGVVGELFPGISGVNKLATSPDIYKSIPAGSSYSPTMADNGKYLIDSLGTAHTIYFDSSLLQDGFSAELHQRSSVIPTISTNFASNNRLKAPTEGGISKIRVASGYLYFDNNASTKNIWVPAKDFYPRLTSGAGTGLIETAAPDRFNYKTLDFDPSLVEYAQADVVLPITCTQFSAQFVWATTSGVGNVKWNIRAAALEDGMTLAATWGTSEWIIDTKTTTSGIQRSSFTSGFYPGDSNLDVVNLPCKIEVFRDSSAAADTLTNDARMLGVVLIPS